jgi:hypothetical protein
VQFDGVLMLDWPLVGIMSLTQDGSAPHLVMQAKRQLPPSADLNTYMMWKGKGSRAAT